MQPEASIIVPVYNAAPFLRACVDSILAQTRTDFELILVNDGSTDDSAAICREYADRDCRVVFLNQDNGGVSSARNHGLDQAAGTYILFADADDTVCPELLEKTLPQMAQGYDLVCFDVEGVSDGDGNSHLLPNMISGEFSLSSEQERMDFLLRHYLTCGLGYYVFNKVYLRRIIQSHGIRFTPGVKIGEDLAFGMTYLLYANRVCSMPERKLYRYWFRAASAMSAAGTDAIRLRDFSTALEAAEGHFADRNADFNRIFVRMMDNQLIKRKNRGLLVQPVREIENIPFFRRQMTAAALHPLRTMGLFKNKKYGFSRWLDCCYCAAKAGR